VVDGKLAELTIVADPTRLAHVDLTEVL